MLAANGILTAKWDGIHLKLSPLNEQHLAIEAAQVSGVNCCATCQHFNDKRSQCQCSDSPLSGLVVDPAGHCLEYASLDDIIVLEDFTDLDDLEEEPEDFIGNLDEMESRFGIGN